MSAATPFGPLAGADAAPLLAGPLPARASLCALLLGARRSPAAAERRGGWTRSSPVVALDVLWNVAFAAAAAAVLARSRAEAPQTPLRLWVAGYALQCVLHVVCMVIEYCAAAGGRGGSPEEAAAAGEAASSVAKHLESANTMFSFFWWIIGFYWVSVGGQPLTQDAPQLYWLCIVFLAFDVFFVVFCVALACIVGVAVCCCLPCIIAILYAVADREGASDEDILQLPKYKFHSISGPNDLCNGTRAHSGIMTECGTDQPIQHALSGEDAECCICLSAYYDGVELREMPCSHHFHCACIDKWLRINAICPLCKYSIIQRHHDAMDEV